MRNHRVSLHAAVPFLFAAMFNVSCADDEGMAGSDSALQVHQAEVAIAANAATGPSGSGHDLYNANCAACPQPTGQGMKGAFPPLAKSDYLKDRDKGVGAVITGLSGPVTVNGVDYDAVMPGHAHLSDADLTAILTYVYASWGNGGGDVSASTIAAARKAAG